jgi:hypothetical protein
MAVKTQGSELWFITGAGALQKVGCVTTISGISSPRDQIETTCLEDDARSYVGGLQTPGTAQFGINFDPSDASHMALETIYGANTSVWWILGWSDGTADPSVDTALLPDLPTTRSWITFQGYVSDLPFDFAINAVVSSSISIQMSGERTLTAKT